MTSLTIEPAETVTIQGLANHVAPDQLAALDEREAGYNLVEVTRFSSLQPSQNTRLLTYVSANKAVGNADHPILQSYLDTVLLGFQAELGEAGIDHFLSTTVGWETPILKDRLNPLYPRAVSISAEIGDFFDKELFKLGARWIDQTP